MNNRGNLPASSTGRAWPILLAVIAVATQQSPIPAGRPTGMPTAGASSRWSAACTRCAPGHQLTWAPVLPRPVRHRVTDRDPSGRVQHASRRWLDRRQRRRRLRVRPRHRHWRRRRWRQVSRSLVDDRPYPLTLTNHGNQNPADVASTRLASGYGRSGTPDSAGSW